MEEQILFEKENIEESKPIDIDEKENSSQETSQYEKNAENEDKLSNKSKEHSPHKDFIEEQNHQEKEEKNVASQNTNAENISTYILKYSRNKEELKEATDTKIVKRKKCSFMLDIKLVPNDNTKKKEAPKDEKEYYLVISCHEIAAFYFDEIYERIYKLEDLMKENRFFRIFEKAEDIKIVIDEFIIKNQKNKNKFFIEFKDKTLKIHMKISFFDKEQEIIFNIPQKKLNIKEKAKLLPEFLREIQHKMIYLCEENKTYKNLNLSQSSKINELKLNLSSSNFDANKSIETTKVNNQIIENNSIFKNKLKNEFNNNKKKIKITNSNK
jgi:hypothetical protein